MFKLITPPGMLLTVALLVIYSVYAFLIGSVEKSWALLAGGVISVIAAIGTAMLRRWSQHLVYLLTAGFIIKLGHSIYLGITSGFFAFQFESGRELLKSLGPSILLALLSCACCFFVFRHFHRSRSARSVAAAETKDNQTARLSSLQEMRLPDE